MTSHAEADLERRSVAALKAMPAHGLKWPRDARRFAIDIVIGIRSKVVAHGLTII
jgi:hypothetical protein